MKVLVAGATGAVGRHAVQQLLAAGHFVRALSRRPETQAGPGSRESHAADLTKPATLAGSCTGIDAVIACAGASLHIGAFRQRASFHDVDLQGNLHLLAEARRCRVGRFIFVSSAGANAMLRTEYAQAHERFGEELAAAGIPYTIVRPTGFFSAFAGWLPWARAGFVPLVGSGAARTNPIHEAEVAQTCVEALFGRQECHTIGGPEIFTRQRLAEMAFDALGKPPRLAVVPPALLRAAGVLGRPFHPRLAALLELGSSVAQTDAIAPPYGMRRLGDYLRALTAVAGSAPSSSRQ
ncbi:MAG TPA: SDR family oxidoreductase [Paludibaculum sp.]